MFNRLLILFLFLFVSTNSFSSVISFNFESGNQGWTTRNSQWHVGSIGSLTHVYGGDAVSVNTSVTNKAIQINNTYIGSNSGGDRYDHYYRSMNYTDQYGRYHSYMGAGNIASFTSPVLDLNMTINKVQMDVKGNLFGISELSNSSSTTRTKQLFDIGNIQSKSLANGFTRYDLDLGGSSYSANGKISLGLEAVTGTKSQFYYPRNFNHYVMPVSQDTLTVDNLILITEENFYDNITGTMNVAMDAGVYRLSTHSSSLGPVLAATDTLVKLPEDQAGLVYAATEASNLISNASADDLEKALNDMLEITQLGYTANVIGEGLVKGLASSLGSQLSGQGIINLSVIQEAIGFDLSRGDPLPDAFFNPEFFALMNGTAKAGLAFDAIDEFRTSIAQVDKYVNNHEAVPLSVLSDATDKWLKASALAVQSSHYLDAAFDTADTGNVVKDFFINLGAQLKNVGNSFVSTYFPNHDTALSAGVDYAIAWDFVNTMQTVEQGIDVMQIYLDAMNDKSVTTMANPLEPTLSSYYVAKANEVGWSISTSTNQVNLDMSLASYFGPGIGSTINDGTNFFSDLYTGSPVEMQILLSSNVSGSDTLSFDYMFGTYTGILDVYIDNWYLGSLNSDISGLMNWDTIYFDISNFDILDDSIFRIVFDGPKASNAKISNLKYYTNLSISEAVPEPSILALIGLGLAGLGVARRKHKVQA